MTWETERNVVRAMLSEEFSRRDFPEKQTAAIIEKGRPTLLLDWLKKVSETFSFIYWYCNGLIATARRLKVRMLNFRHFDNYVLLETPVNFNVMTIGTR